MGVVVRQGLKYAAISYMFMAISIVAVPVLYARNQDLYGVFTFFLDACKLFLPLILLGMGTTVLKFFPEVKKQHGNGNILFQTGLIVVLLTISLLGALGYLFRSDLIRLYETKSELIDVGKYLWVLIPLACFYSLQIFVIAYVSNHRRIAFPKFIQDSWRLVSVVLFALVHYDVIEVNHSLYLMIGHFALCSLILFYYSNRLDPIHIVPFRELKNFIARKDVRTYSFYAILVAMGSSLAFNIDSIMITSMLDTSNTGAYTIANRIGSVIAVPTMAILAIVTPIISAAMTDGNTDEVSKLYRRSSEILTIAGSCLLAGLAVVVVDLFRIMPNGEELVSNGAFYIILLIAVARLFDMMTSVNSQIISMSSYFRYNLIFLGALAMINVILNYFLIGKYGIIGAAWATFTSLVCFNIMKIIFIRSRLQMWPFTRRTLFILLQGLAAIALTYFLFSWVSLAPLVALLVKGAFVVLVLATSYYYTGVSPDYNAAVLTVLRRAKSFIS